MVRKALFLLSLAVLAVGVSGAIASAGTLPSGERSFHNATLEPAYNAENAGQMGFLFTPNKAPMKANPAAWSPLYVVVYPRTAVTVPDTLNCMQCRSRTVRATVTQSPVSHRPEGLPPLSTRGTRPFRLSMRAAWSATTMSATFPVALTSTSPGSR